MRLSLQARWSITGRSNGSTCSDRVFMIREMSVFLCGEFTWAKSDASGFLASMAPSNHSWRLEFQGLASSQLQQATAIQALGKWGLISLALFHSPLSRPSDIRMSRRPASLTRRLGDGAGIPFMGSLNPKSRPSPFLSVGLVLVGAFLIIGYIYSGSGGSNGDKAALSRLEGGVSCSAEINQALPYLKKAYGDSMHKVLHIGPDSCAVVSKLSKEEDTEAWGLEPYDLDDSDANCKSLIRNGVVRVADIKYLNKTLPELARVSSDGFVILSGYPGQRRVKVAEMSKFGRPAKLRSSSWWIRFFVETRLEENEVATKKFEMAAAKKGYQSTCQIFHLKSLS
ncbi:hypothetical protein L1987_02015 [Smallanthus sonchifolius]|uniref:Uncharacterized protein n=1 Tax=Smallanthus sonchifolius TaxID=185202 RepID=A0ACB9K6J1_9ASTR|nr:hypothetical protein L1987_02015 [Smallanthus sonchifolius]